MQICHIYFYFQDEGVFFLLCVWAKKGEGIWYLKTIEVFFQSSSCLSCTQTKSPLAEGQASDIIKTNQDLSARKFEHAGSTSKLKDQGQ